MKIIKISKNYDTSYLQNNGIDLGHFINVFEDKIKGWYLDWADKLKEEEHAGFAALHIGFSYFEAISKFKNSTKGSGKGFKKEIERIFHKDFLKDTTLDKKKTDSIVKLLYDEGRCGFFHSGMSEKGIALEDGDPAIRVKAEDIDTYGKVIKVRIDVKKFIQAIQKDFDLYLNDLRKSSDGSKERNDFKNRWNEINLIKIPNWVKI